MSWWRCSLPASAAGALATQPLDRKEPKEYPGSRAALTGTGRRQRRQASSGSCCELEYTEEGSSRRSVLYCRIRLGAALGFSDSDWFSGTATAGPASLCSKAPARGAGPSAAQPSFVLSAAVTASARCRPAAGPPAPGATHRNLDASQPARWAPSRRCSRCSRRFQRGLKRKALALIKKLRKAKKEAPAGEKPDAVSQGGAGTAAAQG